LLEKLHYLDRPFVASKISFGKTYNSDDFSYYVNRDVVEGDLRKDWIGSKARHYLIMTRTIGRCEFLDSEG